ncbi:tRNA pseudouridine(55) synthase TruB [Deinococcus radiophilus]|uniref:tRNA pseudouridine synthase B n=1 Tax=Deinococcus radiophilus TaxID=32062 RepID=A0A431W623_9DEIO|nr:tRNA pseudouridine(55) synthase TruB [Deinococcus radiophilus]RTR30866.1 tRNA pseudouridine(55) synthase TruB [Deinococcus radiophilus]UFA49447.1 tRNA pseudouridine(55) synthase TruB [Deinococcus radiophilus]
MPVFALDKPLNFTSHDAVARVRRLRATKKVGHTGTLDPLATGVLVVCVGSSTKVVQFMERDSKDYLAWMSLGGSTPTLDAEGPLDEVQRLVTPDPAQIEAALAQFVGEGLQMPPQYSAIQVGGVRAYDVARRGGELNLPARPITIHSLELLGVYDSLATAPQRVSPGPDGWGPDPQGREVPLPPALGDFPTLLVRARVGSGTYLRSLARDLGAALGVPAHLSGLLRTRVGQYDLADALPLDEVAGAAGYSDLSALTLPHLQVTANVATELRQGKRPRRPEVGRYAVIQGGELIAVADGDGEMLKAVRVWAD